MTRKILAITAAACSAALVLAACSGGDDPAPAPTGTGGSAAPGGHAGTEIGFFTDKAAWEPSFDAMNDASKDTTATLSFTGYSDPTAYDAFIKQAFRTKDKPDLFTWHTGDQLKALVDEGLVAETTDLWKAAIDAGNVSADLAENYTYDGKQYCVPLNVVYWVMYYNKKTFADNGLEVPTTWAEFTAAADKLVAAGVTPLHQMNIIFEFVWFQAILAGLDPDAYNGLSDGSVKYTDPVVKEAMGIWHDMQTKKYFIDPGVTTDPQTLLQTGETAMAYFGTFFTGQLTGLGMKSDEDYGMFVLPAVTAGAKTPVIVETGPLCVGKGSKNEAAALDYSSWWMGEPAQSAWSAARGDVSFNPKATVADKALADITKLVNGDGYLQLRRYLEATPTPIYTVASEQFGAFVTNNGDPSAVLEKIQAEADKYWADK